MLCHNPAGTLLPQLNYKKTLPQDEPENNLFLILLIKKKLFLYKFVARIFFPQSNSKNRFGNKSENFWHIDMLLYDCKNI